MESLLALRMSYSSCQPGPAFSWWPSLWLYYRNLRKKYVHYRACSCPAMSGFHAVRLSDCLTRIRINPAGSHVHFIIYSMLYSAFSAKHQRPFDPRKVANFGWDLLSFRHKAMASISNFLSFEAALPTIGIAAAIWLFYKIITFGRREKSLPPGPPTIPILGNAHLMPTQDFSSQ